MHHVSIRDEWVFSHTPNLLIYPNFFVSFGIPGDFILSEISLSEISKFTMKFSIRWHAVVMKQQFALIATSVPSGYLPALWNWQATELALYK